MQCEDCEMYETDDTLQMHMYICIDVHMYISLESLKSSVSFPDMSL